MAQTESMADQQVDDTIQRNNLLVAWEPIFQFHPRQFAATRQHQSLFDRRNAPRIGLGGKDDGPRVLSDISYLQHEHPLIPELGLDHNALSAQLVDNLID